MQKAVVVVAAVPSVAVVVIAIEIIHVSPYAFHHVYFCCCCCCLDLFFYDFRLRQ